MAITWKSLTVSNQSVVRIRGSTDFRYFVFILKADHQLLKGDRVRQFLYNKKAFTVIEIMIGVVIIALLAAGMMTVNVLRARQNAESSLCMRNRILIEQAEVRYFTDRGAHSENMQNLVDEGYFVEVPECPAKGIYAWVPESEGSASYQAQIGCSIHGATVSLEDGVVYDFNEGDADGWDEVRGRYWEVKDGKYYAGREGKGSGEHRSFFGDESWTDYAVSVDAELFQGQGYGVYFRAQDFISLDSYIFQYDPGYGSGEFIFRTVVNGREKSPFARAKPPEGFQWTGVEREITVEAVGSSLKAYVDGVLVLEANDSTYSQGAIGLRTWGKSYASFDNVEVTQSP